MSCQGVLLASKQRWDVQYMLQFVFCSLSLFSLWFKVFLIAQCEDVCASKGQCHRSFYMQFGQKNSSVCQWKATQNELQAGGLKLNNFELEEFNFNSALFFLWGHFHISSFIIRIYIQLLVLKYLAVMQRDKYFPFSLLHTPQLISL